MKLGSSLLFASRLLFPKTGKKSNARRSLFGAFVCIGISLVPMIMVLTISNGMISGIKQRYIGLSSGHVQCEVLNSYQNPADLNKLSELSTMVENLPQVKTAFAQVENIGLAAGKNGRTGATIRAIQNDLFQTNASFNSLFEVLEGSPQLSTNTSAIIGEKLAQNLGVNAGDKFRLITVSKNEKGRVITKSNSFTVEAIVSCGYQELDALWVFIPLEKGLSILPMDSSQIRINVELTEDSAQILDSVSRKIESMDESFVSVKKWNEIKENKVFFDNFDSTQVMLILIMFLIILVASVNISSALIMLVMERRKEIAILKSLGASSSGITVSFLITGMVTGGLGILAGVPVGLLCAVNFNTIISFIEKLVNNVAVFLYSLFNEEISSFTEIQLLSPEFYLQKIDISIPLGQLMMICGATLVLSLLVSAIPAIKAGKEKPLDIMRKM